MRGCLCTSLVACLCLFLAACATIGPPLPPSLELPNPPSDLRAARKGNRVDLAWTVPRLTTDRLRVRVLGPTRICRGDEPALSQCGSPLEQVAPPDRAVLSNPGGKQIPATYTDTLPKALERSNPLGFATYSVEVLNTKGRSAGLSNQVRVPLVETLPPPRDFDARVSAQGVVFAWTADMPATSSQPPMRIIYRLFRRPGGSKQAVLVGQVPVGKESSLSLTDPGIEWEQTYYYHADAVTAIAQPDKTEVQVEGDDTPEIKVFTHDVFPPAVPSGLQAVYSGPGQQPFVDLIWSPVSDVDLKGYNLYRREGGGVWLKLNIDPLTTPAYRDANVAPGKKYVYSVTAVDVRGNESAQSDETAESVPPQ